MQYWEAFELEPVRNAEKPRHLVKNPRKATVQIQVFHSP